MRKFIGGVVLVILAIYLLRKGATADAVLGQASAALDWLIGLGAKLADWLLTGHAPAGGKP